MKTLGIGWALALCFIGNANAQVPGDPLASPVPIYAVDGIVLGSRVKFDSSMYREYQCAPSEQFHGFTWCQRSSREGERRGSFDAKYSLLHFQDGTVAYANRYQQPAFLDASEAEREILNYSRKFGESPRITDIPRRSRTPHAILATWGKTELEPLDDESAKLLEDGKRPKRGLLIDFLGNFARSAQEGLPIYRIVGGAGFVWVSSFDHRGSGIVRFAAVNASILQSGPVSAQSPNGPQKDRHFLADQSEQILVTKDEEQLAATIKARSDAEATIARLEAELSIATTERTAAELARTEAEKIAQQARTDAEIAHKKFEAAIEDVITTKEQFQKLTGSGTPTSYTEVIILIAICATAILLLLTWVLSRLLHAFLRPSVHLGKTFSDLEIQNDGIEGALVPLPGSRSSARAASTFNQDELVNQLAKTLGVHDPVTPLPAEVPLDTDLSAIKAKPQGKVQTNPLVDALGHTASERVIKYIYEVKGQKLCLVFGKIER